MLSSMKSLGSTKHSHLPSWTHGPSLLLVSMTRFLYDYFSEIGICSSYILFNDQVQQEYWQKETQRLWEFSTERNETFEFMTIDDVLEENAKCKEENQRLHDIIDDNITDLYQRMDDNDIRVTENRDAIIVNTDLISDLETESKQL